MIFNVSDDAYDRFMGRYSRRLASPFADFAGVQAGQRALDAGAGTGALTAELIRRGAAVAAAEPSAGFAAGLQARYPEIEVRDAPAENLPWADGSFDAALAQLVVSFVADAPAAAAELRRVVRPGGVVAACSWGLHPHGLDLRGPLQAARDAAAPDAPRPTDLQYRTEEELVSLLVAAGLRDVDSALLEVEAEYSGFDDFWDAALETVGPDTAWIRALDDDGRAVARDAARQALPSDGPFTLGARAHAVRGTV
jgi:SAM-dependent methyltransferase